MSDATPRRLMDDIGLFALIMRRCRAAGSQAAFARAHGMSPQTLSDILNNRTEMSDAFLRKLKVRRIVRYEDLSETEGGAPPPDMAHLRLAQQPREAKDA